jgi:hypothetical protein
MGRLINEQIMTWTICIGPPEGDRSFGGGGVAWCFFHSLSFSLILS